MQLTESASSVDHHLTLADRFLAVRSVTESLASCLSAEDQTVQSMPDVSPTKWHRASHYLVLRVIPPRPESAGLPSLPFRLRLPFQFLL